MLRDCTASTGSPGKCHGRPPTAQSRAGSSLKYSALSRLRDHWAFLWGHRRYWLAPTLVTLVCLIVIVLLDKGAVSIPLMYRFL